MSATMSGMQLVWPAHEHLASYASALARGWSPNNLRPEAAREQLADIGRDAHAFLAALVDIEARGKPITLPDGSQVARLPGYTRWMWDGEFCGSIQLRWQNGTTALPTFCLGHIGYGVVPWKQRRGHATRALGLLLADAARRGLPHVELTTQPANLASQKVITANGGVLVEKFTTLPALGGREEWRYRVPTAR